MLTNLIFERDEHLKELGETLKAFKLMQKDHWFSILYTKDSNNFFRCGAKSTFGSVHRSSKITNGVYRDFLSQLYLYLEKNFNGFEIKIPPEYVDKTTHVAFKEFFQNGLCNQIIETNQYLKIDPTVSRPDFSKTNRKILSRHRKNGSYVRFSNEVNPEGYDILKKNREARGVQLSLTFHELKSQSQKSPNHYVFASCYDQVGSLMAYAVCVKLSEEILYVLYWGDHPKDRKKSPVVFLCDEIFTNSKHLDYRILDIGISSVNGTLDKSLFAFKSRLGCSNCEKLILRKNYA